MNKEVTVILNGFRRGECLDEQVNALNNGSIVPKKIMLWYNYPDKGDVNYGITEKVSSAISNENLGVWARFAYALNSRTEYVCVFDDDMVPGPLWLENCINSINIKNGLMGGVGLLYSQPNPPERSSYYEHYTRFGWVDGGQSNEITEVDFVGHSWFFRRDWLSMYWRELPDPKYFICKEDMHFSHMLQKYGNIKTYVPPHPIDNKDMWCNIAHIKYACDNNSMWETNQRSPEGVPFKHLMNQAFVDQRIAGWKLIKENV
jgi:GT2 family glycosyltransferase